MQKRKSRSFTVSLFVILGGLLITAAIFDLQIARAIYMPENAFAEFFYRIGELPAHLILPFAAMIFFHDCPEKLMKTRLFWQIGFAIFTILGYYALFSKFGKHWFIDDQYRSIFEIVFAISFALIALWLSSYIPKDKIKALSRFALFAVIVGLLSNYLVVLLKDIWGRVRFRDLVGPDYSSFTPWFSPKGDSGSSFPSGHAVAAASSFIIVALTDVFKSLKKYELSLFLFALLTSVLVSLSRMLMGAHFLSDVTISILIAFTFFTILRKYYFKKERQG